MKTAAFRALALILLILSLITWGGAANVAAAWMQPEVADGCCERSGSGESVPSPCSAEECPCFSCLPFAPPGLLGVDRHAAPGVRLQPPPLTIPPPEIIRAIDYPPEIS